MAKYQYKGSDIVTPFTISTNKPFYEAETYNLRVQRASQDAQRWELSFTTVSKEQAAVDMFVSLIEDMDVVETMVMPQLVENTVAGVLQTNAALANADFFSLNSTTGVTGGWKKGQFISFQNHDKVYMIKQDTPLNGNVPIYPNLVTAVNAGTTVYVGNDVVLSYLRTVDTLTGITFDDGVLASPGTINLIEAV